MSALMTAPIQPSRLNSVHCTVCSFVARSPPLGLALLLELASLSASAPLLVCLLCLLCQSAYACPSRWWLSASALLLGRLPLSLSLVVAPCCQGCSAPVASPSLLNRAVLYLTWMEVGRTLQRLVGPPSCLLTCGSVVTLLAVSCQGQFSPRWFALLLLVPV